MNCSTTGHTEESIGTDNWRINPTIGKILIWCYEKYIEFVNCLNLFSFVDPHPTNLINLRIDELNDVENNSWIENVCGEVDQVIFAYGDCEGIDEEIFNNRKDEILDLLGNKDIYNVGALTEKIILDTVECGIVISGFGII